jgi:putative heme transporter
LTNPNTTLAGSGLPPGDGESVPQPRKLTWPRAIRALAAFGVAAAIFLYFLPRVVDYGEVWAVVQTMTWLEVVTLAVLAVWNQATYWLVEVAGRSGLTYGQAMKITMSSTAMGNTLPGGAALGAGLQFAMYLSYGFAPPDIAVSLAMTGLWNTFAKLSMPIVALAILAIGGDAGSGYVIASLLGVVILVTTIAGFAVVLRSERGAARVGRRLGSVLSWCARIARRPQRDWATIVTDFRRRTMTLVAARWAPLTVTVAVSHLTLYLVLLLSLRHVGVPQEAVTWAEVLAAFAFVRLLSALPITPGGVGVVELGLAATLIAAGGNDALVVAGVLVYRLLTFVLPIPAGVIAYLAWRREKGRGPTTTNASPM